MTKTPKYAVRVNGSDDVSFFSNKVDAVRKAKQLVRWVDGWPKLETVQVISTRPQMIAGRFGNVVASFERS